MLSVEPAVGGTQVAKKKILLVDADPRSLRVVEVSLRKAGYNVACAEDGISALEIIDEQQPDLVICDTHLPKLDGYGACRWIRGRPWGGSMVLVALTGWGQEEDRRRSRQAGFDHHLVKPVDPRALVKLLAELPVTEPARPSVDRACGVREPSV